MRPRQPWTCRTEMGQNAWDAQWAWWVGLVCTLHLVPPAAPKGPSTTISSPGPDIISSPLSPTANHWPQRRGHESFAGDKTEAISAFMPGSPASLAPVTSTRQISHSLSHVRLTTSLTVTGHAGHGTTARDPRTTHGAQRPPTRPGRLLPLSSRTTGACVYHQSTRLVLSEGLHRLPRHTHANRTSVAL